MGKRAIFFITVFLAAPFVLMPPAKGQQPSLYDVRKMSFNLPGFSEIAPVIVDGGLIFCSDKRYSVITDRTSFSGNRLYNIYRAEMIDSSEWDKPVEIKSERSYLFNNGPFSISPDGKTIYLTSEIETGPAAKKRRYKNHSGIFIAEIAGSEIASLKPFKYNSQDYDAGQPSISSDGKYLFFASNMPGGEGGSDIFYCEFRDGDWAPPVNLGPDVNSPGTENFPYMHSSGRLFFTSDRQGGMGNLDIYYTSLTDGKWDEPTLLPEPINSSSDDFGLVADGTLSRGYFSSNRNRSDDIFRFISTIIRMPSCNGMEEDSYCFRFVEENAVRVDTMPFRYDWRFGDGEQASGPVVEHCYSGPGTYIVQLDVVNLLTKEVSMNEKSDTLVVSKIEQPYFTAPDTITAGQRISLDASLTFLPSWNITQYYWNFGDETVSLGRMVEKSFLKPGVYNVQLIVSDTPQPGAGAREACVSKNIVVLNKP